MARPTLICPASVLLFALAAVLVGACDRTPSYRQTRAGMAIAIETRHTAAEVAERAAAQADPACGAYRITGQGHAEVHWVVEGARQGAIALELDETRTLDVDAAGNLRVLRRVEFLAERGRTGVREREWRLVGGELYTRDVNLPFERRQADVTDAERLRDQTAEVFETLVRAVGEGWAVVEPGPTGFELTGGGEVGVRVRCGREGAADPWLGPLLEGARITEARASVVLDATGRVNRRSGSFTWAPREGQGRDLRVVVEEQADWAAAVEPITAPESIADAEPRRLYAQVNGFLRELESLEGVRLLDTSGEGTGLAEGSGEGSDEGAEEGMGD